MKAFKVHEDTAFEPFVPSKGASKPTAALGKAGIAPEAENADARKKTKGGLAVKFGAELDGGSSLAEVKRAKKEEAVPDVEHVHRTELAWEPPEELRELDRLASYLGESHAKQSSDAVTCIEPQLEVSALLELNESFQPDVSANGGYFEISLDVDDVVVGAADE